MRKIKKTLSLPLDVVERLEDETNQSALVERLLREHYGMASQSDTKETDE